MFHILIANLIFNLHFLDYFPFLWNCCSTNVFLGLEKKKKCSLLRNYAFEEDLYSLWQIWKLKGGVTKWSRFSRKSGRSRISGSGPNGAATAPLSAKGLACRRPAALRPSAPPSPPSPPSLPSWMPRNLFHTNLTTLWLNSTFQLLRETLLKFRIIEETLPPPPFRLW